MLVMDVDGVLTDGSIVYDDAGHELKRFNVRDGLWIRSWINLGLDAAILSARASSAVQRRAEELGINRIIQGSGNKGAHIQSLSSESGIELSEMAYLGDDLPDLAALGLVGYPMAVANADERVIAAARYVTSAPGGHGAVREAIIHILETMGRLDDVLAKYDGR